MGAQRRKILKKGVRFARELQTFAGGLDADSAAVVHEFKSHVQLVEAAGTTDAFAELWYRHIV